jgi:predicted HicB family RNase H-like nuclease
MAQKPLVPGRSGKSPLIAVRVPPSDRERLIRASTAHGLTLAQYVRRTLEAAIAAEEALTGQPDQAAVA